VKLFRIKSLDEARQSADVEERRLRRVLKAKDIVFLGIGAIIGAGIFSTIGSAAQDAGPALVLSFALLGVVCALAGLCYAELTSMIPVAGSAYTYAFATMGEFMAWIIGWDLILEYAVGNVAVAIAWSNYFREVLEHVGLRLPDWLAYSIGDVHERIRFFGAEIATASATLAESPAGAPNDAAAAGLAWATAALAEWQGRLESAPTLLGYPVLVNLPAILIVAVITVLLVRGVRESVAVNNFMVWIKFVVLALFIGVGAFHIDPANWTPFAPNGFPGIHAGAAAVFFAYIGFDAVSTATEEVENPSRDMPIGILGSLAICTVLYMIVGLIATGLVPYKQLQGSEPLADALAGHGLESTRLIVSIGAVVSMTAVLLVFQLGQARILFAMSRDGLLPATFAKVHPKYRTPHFTTILTGLAVAIGAAVMDDDATYDLTSIGTLFAFLVACLGVIVLRFTRPDAARPFRVPYVWIVAPGGAAFCVFTMMGLSWPAWERFLVWLALGIAIYFVRGLFFRPRAT
jgi:APA family basic amino acid/polyamine antiporter